MDQSPFHESSGIFTISITLSKYADEANGTVLQLGNFQDRLGGFSSSTLLV